jgi:hypothetical protein
VRGARESSRIADDRRSPGRHGARRRGVPEGRRAAEGPLLDWKAKGHRVELLGKDALPGGPAHRLKVTTKNGVVRDVWVDAASGHVVRTIATRAVRGREAAVETTFGDYRPEGVVAFPRSIETGVEGRPRRLRIVVLSVEVNVPLDESRFRMPR